MCDPVSLTVGAIAMSGVSTAISYDQQKKAARRAEAHGQAQYAQDMAFREQQEAFQLERYIENADRVHAEVRRNYSEIDQRIGQDAQVAAMEVGKFISQSRALQSTGTTADAERGVQGATADYIMDNIHRHMLGNVENIRREQKWRLDAMMGMKDEIEAQGLARIEGMNPQPLPMPNLPPPVQHPDPMVALMNFGSQAMGTYANFLQMQPAVPSGGTWGAGTAGGGATAASNWGMGFNSGMSQTQHTNWLQTGNPSNSMMLF